MEIIKGIIELFFSISLFANAVLFIPQAIKIFRNKTAQEVSLITFLGFLTIQIFFVLHGLLVHDYLLAFGMSWSILTCGTVVVLILIYRKTPPLDIEN